MAVSTFSRRILLLLGLGVALPAMVLAGLGIALTLRIWSAFQSQSLRYNHYMAQQVAQGFEQELMAHVRESIAAAENVARSGGGPQEVTAALESGRHEFQGAQFVPLEQLPDYYLLVVESQPLVYGAQGPAAPGRRFAGTMLRDGQGQIIGAGGWWFDPRPFLARHLHSVMEDRLASNERIYGGIESTRNLSVLLMAPEGRELGRVREPGDSKTAALEPLSGPFEGYTVRVSATPNAPVAWTNRFLLFEIGFISLMGLVIALALLFGLRYTVRQIELARLKSGFVSNVSHELKTPISLIRLAVETLEMHRFSSPEEGDKFLRLISRETERLNHLVDNILDFARLEAGQRPFKFETVDVAHLVSETLDSFRLRLEDQGFTLVTDVPERLPRVRGDGTAIAQCLLNLLDNAMKYSRERREIRVAVGTRDHAVWVSVSDRGIGIQPRDQRRIFEKFVRLESGLVHDVKGAGLGLSLVDQIMKAHSGRVEVTSAPGEGSTFTLVLPAAKGVVIQEPEPHAKTAS